MARILVTPGPDGRLLVRVPYSHDRVEAIRAVPGRRWHPDRRAWSVPDAPDTLDRLRDAFPDDDVQLSPGLSNWRDELLDRTHRQLVLRGYSPRTRRAYLFHARHFLAGLDAPPGEDLSKDIADFLLHRVQHDDVSTAYHNQAVSALRFFTAHVLGRDDVVKSIARPRRERRLPVVLSKGEVKRLMAAIRNPKHRAIIALVYASGLRVSEVVRLKPEDIDTDRGLLLVRGAKGRKDRVTLLADSALKELQAYLELEPAGHWLFPGGRSGRHLTVRSVQKTVERARKRAGITKRFSVHALRHSFATHLHEAGVDIRYIQELLGHMSTRTTEIYTHVARTNLARIPSPMDRLDDDDEEEG